MPGIQIETAPFCEPLSLTEVKNWLRVTATDDDDLITDLIVAAREFCENYTRRSFINKGYIQTFDCFPYFADTALTMQAYPPAYYSLSRYSTTMWNYSQQIKLLVSKLAAAPTVRYVGTDGVWHTLTGTLDVSDGTADFLCASEGEPPRLFPKAGNYWQAVFYVPESVEIHFVAGYNDDAAIKVLTDAYKLQSPVPTAQEQSDYEAGLRRADVPALARAAMRSLIAHWYDNRPSNMADALKEVPLNLSRPLNALKVFDEAPTRG